MFGLSVDDFDFGEEVIRVRRQVKRLGKAYVFALPKNDKERIVPMSAALARQAVDRRLERLASRLTEQSRSGDDHGRDFEDPSTGPHLL